MRTHVALLRGVNVGSAGRVAMADLLVAFAEVGFTDVLTVLNSGNVVFSSSLPDTKELARLIEQTLVSRLAFSTRVVVLTAAELARVVRADPFGELATNPSRLIVAFLADSTDMRSLEPLLERDWSPEALALGERVAYLWCPDGTVASPVAQAVGRTAGDATTTRSWGTVMKLQALLGGE